MPWLNEQQAERDAFQHKVIVGPDDRFAADWEPSFPGETLLDALGRAQADCQEIARSIVSPPEMKERWQGHVRAISHAICELRKTK